MNQTYATGKALKTLGLPDGAKIKIFAPSG
jgi:hypothetical protein